MKEPLKCQVCGSDERIIGQDYDKATHDFYCFPILVKVGNKYAYSRIYLCGECSSKYCANERNAIRKNQINWGKKLKE